VNSSAFNEEVVHKSEAAAALASVSTGSLGGYVISPMIWLL